MFDVTYTEMTMFITITVTPKSDILFRYKNNFIRTLKLEFP